MSEIKKGLFDLTIREAKKLELKMADLFVIEIEGKNTTLNLSWDHVIRVVNYLSGTETLTEDSTLMQSFTAMRSFL